MSHKKEEPLLKIKKRVIKFVGGFKMPMTSFTLKTSGEVITILRIAYHYAWRWDNPLDGKSYGDYTIQPPFNEPSLDKRIKELIEQIETSKGAKKEKRIKQLKDVTDYYDQLKVEDANNLLSVLVLQADTTIEESSKT